MLPRRILAIDVGERRVGLAIADTSNCLPRPFNTLANTENIFKEICQVVNSESVDTIVVGLPRNLDGEETAQTRYARKFAKNLQAYTTADLYFEDEALSSVRAENDMKLMKNPTANQSVDALAASYILDDFLLNHKDEFHG